MQQQSTQRLSPFRVRILLPQTCNHTGGSRYTDGGTNTNLDTLLLASYRTLNDDITVPKLDDSIPYFEQELGVGRLNQLSEWLWVAGRPMPPRPLHFQLFLRREIVIVEQMDLHLVWTSGRIFLKPVPRYLLEPSFWTSYLACRQDRPCTPATDNLCPHQRLWKCALGFLFSYAALLCYESDFRLARERHLLPEEVQWHDWRTLVQELGTEYIYDKIDARYIYGELRLSRLDKIQSLRSSTSYVPFWSSYSHFFRENFTSLASVTVYVVIVLTAMQVGLATEALGQNQVFQSASYGFTVFSIVGPLAAVGLVICVFLYLFVSNWLAAVVYRRRRLLHIQSRTESA
ncbi:hypothetical protein F4808DRAFT_459950 [Astrocystis sublimbata]|nr:hypothetical protein F4808DRAFT_459950 [Astrocystis sublimbata]